MGDQAQLLQREKSAYATVEPPCPVFGTCGGCALQDLAYPDQLALKRRRLQRALAPLGELPPFELIGLEDPWRYRNKAELTFGQQNGTLLLGYHAARSFWRIVDWEDCRLLPESVARMARDLRALAEQTGLPAYHPRTHQGFFRHLLVRHSHATGNTLLGLITAPGPRETVEALAQAVCERHPAVASFYWGVTSRLADVAVPEELTLLRGSPYLEDRIGPFRLRLHPLSFLQPCSVQADRAYVRLAEALAQAAAPSRRGTSGATTIEVVAECRTRGRPASAAGTVPPRSAAGPGRVAWDLYCGLGLVSFYLAPHFRTIYAIDSEPHHLELARENAAENGLSHIEFRTGKVEVVLRDRRFWLQEARPDAVVVDPPRVGLHADALASLTAARPRHIAYLSCNAQSLVRDVGWLRSGFPRYRVAALHAFDMFPQTNHVEVLVVLEREG